MASSESQPDVLEKQRKSQLRQLKEFYPPADLSTPYRGICLIVNNLDNDTPFCLRELKDIGALFQNVAINQFGNETIKGLINLVENLINLKHKEISVKQTALSNLIEFLSLDFHEGSAKFEELNQKVTTFNEKVKSCKKEIEQIKENVDNAIKPLIQKLFDNCRNEAEKQFEDQKRSYGYSEEEESVSAKKKLIQKLTSLMVEDFEVLESKLKTLKVKFDQQLKQRSDCGNTILQEVFSLVENLKKLNLDDVDEKLKVLNSLKVDGEQSSLLLSLQNDDINNLYNCHESVHNFRTQIREQEKRVLELRDELEDDIHSVISSMSNIFSDIKNKNLTKIQEEFQNDENNQSLEELQKKKTIVGNLFSMIDNFGLFKSGSNKDCQKLRKTFSDLRYSVRYCRNLSADEMGNEMKKLAAMDHRKYDSVVLCFVSHGAQNKIIGCDFRELKIEEIVDQLNSESAKSLKGKPKMIFVAACRGNQIDRGDTVCNLAAREDENLCIPLTRDFFFAFATYEGYMAHITKDGTFFIQSLCDHLKEYGRYCKLTSLMPIVNRDVEKRMREFFNNVNLNKMFNVVSYSSSLSKQFKF